MHSVKTKVNQPLLPNGSMKHVVIHRKNDKGVAKRNMLDEPRLWKKEVEICKKNVSANFPIRNNETKVFINNKQKGGNNKCENNAITCNTYKNAFHNDLALAKKKLSIEIAASLWNKINVEKEGAIDLFNDSIYIYFSEREKKIFRENFISYFISYSENAAEITNDVFQEKINLQNKNHKNVHELKRIATENDCCLLVNCNKEDLLFEEKPLLLVSKHFFFETIYKIVMNVDCFNTKKYTFLVLQLLQLSKDISKNTNNMSCLQRNDCSNGDDGEDIYDNLKTPKENMNHKVSYSVKHFFPVEDKRRVLTEEDYKVIEKENVVNDLIHLSIVELANNVKQEDITEKLKLKNNEKIKIRHKKKNDKIYDSVFKNRNSNGYNPVKILKQFLENDSNILDYKDLLNELRCCTFQPNIHKYIEYEKQHKTQKKKEKEVINEENKDSEKECRKDEKDLIDETCEEILISLKKPLYDIENADIEKYLKAFDMYYSTEDKKKKTYTLEYENPTHRRNRRHFRSSNICATKTKDVEVRDLKKNAHVNYKNKWMDELRNGYKSTTFNFSLQDVNENKFEIEKNDRRKNMNWKKTIRLANRRMKTRVIPNFDLVNKMVNVDSTYEEEPTNFVVKQKSLYVYNSSGKDGSKGIPKKTLMTLSQHNQECESSKKCNIKEHSAFYQKTNFLIPTPRKTHKYNRQLRIKNELKNFEELTSFAPPKVISVESDTILDDIKKEILSLPNSINFLTYKQYNRK